MPRRCSTPARTARSRRTGGNLASPLLAEAVGGGDGSDRRRRPAGADLGGGVRDDPRGGRRADADLGVVGRARPLRQRVQEGHGDREAGGQGRPDRGVRDRRRRDLLAIPAQKLNIAFLVALAFAVAASANLPSLVYNLFWRRFNTRGATWSIYGGLVSCVGLVFFSPVVSGKVQPDRRERVAVRPAAPTSAGSRWRTRASSRSRSASSSAGSARSRRRTPEAEAAYDELEVRSLTGAGAEKAATQPLNGPRTGATHRGAPTDVAPGERSLRRSPPHSTPIGLRTSRKVSHRRRETRSNDELERDPVQPLPRGAALRAAGRPGAERQRHRGRLRRGRRRPARVLGEAGRADRLGRAVGPRCSTGTTRRSPSGSSAASSTRRTTASTGTSRPAAATRSRSTGSASPGDTRTITYADLKDEVCKAANALTELGVETGDRVAIYMPMIPETVIAMLACARLGAPHTVVFGGFSADALAEPDRRLRRAGGHHRRRRLPPRRPVRAQAGRRRGRAAKCRPTVAQRARRQAHRPGRRVERRRRRLVARRRRQAARPSTTPRRSTPSTRCT